MKGGLKVQKARMTRTDCLALGSSFLHKLCCAHGYTHVPSCVLARMQAHVQMHTRRPPSLLHTQHTHACTSAHAHIKVQRTHTHTHTRTHTHVHIKVQHAHTCNLHNHLHACSAGAVPHALSAPQVPAAGAIASWPYRTD